MTSADYKRSFGYNGRRSLMAHAVRTQRLAAQLEEALSTRGVIEQAKGILIARQGCSADQAFQLLVQLSQRTHVKLHDVARDLVDRARGQATAAGQDPAQPWPGQ